MAEKGIVTRNESLAIYNWVAKVVFQTYVQPWRKEDLEHVTVRSPRGRGGGRVRIVKNGVRNF